jgi:hypothetical protein
MGTDAVIAPFAHLRRGGRVEALRHAALKLFCIDQAGGMPNVERAFKQFLGVCVPHLVAAE